MTNNNTVRVALTKCFYCGGNSDILMNKTPTKHLAKKVESMHGKVVSMEPCQTCKEYMKLGIIAITYDEKLTDDKKNPYRTGGFFVLAEHTIAKLIDDEELLRHILSSRFFFMQHEVAETTGLFEMAKDTESKTKPA